MKISFGFWAVCASLFLFCSCSRKGTWQLAWQDDFENGRMDTTVWSRIWRGTADWDNTQDPRDPRLVTFRDGCIVLRGIINDHRDKDDVPHLTGGIWSRDRHPFTCGSKGARFLVRARLQSAQGAWPAVWLMPFDNGPWPTGGEIDIMERLSFDNIIHQTVHTPFTQKNGGIKHSQTTSLDPSVFNEYGVDIFPDSIVFHINGTPTYTYHRDPSLPDSLIQFPFFRDQHFRIDQQLGGGWVGKVKDEDLPVEMEVDWVRHYLRR